MISVRRLSFLLLLVLGTLAVAENASAQIRVDMALRRALFLRYEPVMAIVSITNMSGGELQLADEGNHKWFSFHIEHPSDDADGDAIVPPYNPDYSLTPVVIEPGQTVKRAVNITPLYPITEYGIYRVRATVYDSKTGRYYSSNTPLNITITEGTTLWTQTIGMPDTAQDGAGGGQPSNRVVSLISQRLPDNTQLYLRIEDQEKGMVYCTAQLGRVVSFDKPEVKVSADNDVHILQNVAPRLFLYTHANLDGKILERKQYAGSETTRPALRRDTSGGVQIVGGMYIDPNAATAQQNAAPPTSISDRPVPLPKSQ